MRRLIRLFVFLCLSLLIHAGISRLPADQAPGHNSTRSIQVSLVAIEGADRPEAASVQKPDTEPRQKMEALPDAGPGLVPDPDRKGTAAQDAQQQREERAAGQEPVVLPAAIDSTLAADLYRGKVLDIIRRNLHYPVSARRRGVEGTVSVRLTIRGPGTAGDILIEKTSGSAILDRASVRILGECVFPPPPRGDITLHIPITFRLVEEP